MAPDKCPIVPAFGALKTPIEVVKAPIAQFKTPHYCVKSTHVFTKNVHSYQNGPLNERPLMRARARKKHPSRLKNTHCAHLKPPIYVLRIISVFMGGAFNHAMGSFNLRWALFRFYGPF